MSDITKLTNNIIQEAEAKKTKLVQTAQKQAEQYIKQQELLEVEQFEHTVTRYRNEAQAKMQQHISKQSIVNRNKILQTKQEKLSLVYERVTTALQNLTREDILPFVDRVLAESTFTGEILVQIGANSKDLLTKADLQKLQQKYAPAKMFIFDESYLPNVGGIILSQNAIELNYTFEAILQTMEQELNPQIMDCLFGKAGQTEK